MFLETKNFNLFSTNGNLNLNIDTFNLQLNKMTPVLLFSNYINLDSANQINFGAYDIFLNTQNLILNSNQLSFTGGHEGIIFSAEGDFSFLTTSDVNLFSENSILFTSALTTFITSTTGSFDLNSNGGDLIWTSEKSNMTFTATSGAISINSGENLIFDCGENSGNLISLSSGGSVSFNSQTGSNWKTEIFSFFSTSDIFFSAGSNFNLNSVNKNDWSSNSFLIESTYSNIEGGEITFNVNNNFVINSYIVDFSSKSASLLLSEGFLENKDGIYLTSLTSSISMTSTASFLLNSNQNLNILTDTLNQDISFQVTSGINLNSGLDWTKIESGGEISINSKSSIFLTSSNDIEFFSETFTTLTSNSNINLISQIGDINFISLFGCIHFNTTIGTTTNILIQSTFSDGSPINFYSKNSINSHTTTGAISLISLVQF